MSHAVSFRRMICACAAALAASAMFGGAAIAADDPAAPGCPPIPTVQPFGPWQDFADYFLAPDGDIEAGGAGWDLSGGAAAVEGNEPFFASAAGDHLSLRIPPAAVATTAPLCVAAEHRTMRFFARASGAGALQVHAVFDKRSAQEKSVHLATIVADGDWSASPIIAMRVNELAPAYGNQLPVSLRFSARGAAEWQIDDVFVDPYRKG